MTIPSRPAPAPPGSRAQNAAAGANASIEQLRLQLQQQQQQQQQNGGIQKLTIKLPPPPKGPSNYNNTGLNYNNNNSNTNNINSSSITRKFPQARYAPSTNWDDSPFEVAGANGNFKKVPPPRPPPPKVQVNGGVRKAIAPTPPPIQSSNILTNMFNRKKAAAATKANGASRVYGMSSGIYGSTAATSATASSANYHTTNSYVSNSSSSVNWNANWNTNTGGSSYSASSLHTTTTTAGSSSADAQLISFDSPPSSPTFTQKSNSDCVSVDSFSSDSNFSSPNNGSVSQPESGFEDDFSAARSRPPTTSPLDPWETLDAFSADPIYGTTTGIGTAPVRNYNTANTRILASNDNPLCNGKSLLPPAPSLTMPTIIKPKISQKPKAPKPPMLGKQFSAGHTQMVFNGGDLATPPSPPMPHGAPPPPPAGFSLLDVISGKVDALHLGQGHTYDEEVSKPYGYALYDFEGAEEGDLSFRENDKIWLLEQVSEEWYRGRTRTGCEGIFPVNYIDIKVALGTPASTPIYQQQSEFTMQSHTTSTAAATSSSSSSGSSVGFKATPRVRSLYNFPAEVEGDLALKENDLITILYRINEDWLYGEVDGRQGQFPSNFLEYVPDNIPLP